MRGGTFVVIAAAVVAAPAAARQGQDAALASLVEAERAFARASVQTTQRDAFLANFADDGVSFAPRPVNTKASLQDTPPTRAFTLDWEPVTGDVAASGDLGYSTGPYRVSSDPDGTSVTNQGWFFSVWTRVADGRWRVAADFGVRTPPVGALRPREFRRSQSRGVPPEKAPAPGAGADELLAAERAFADRASKDGSAAAYRALATADVRVYRDGSVPLVGPAEAEPRLPRPGARIEWRPERAVASAAGDLGFAYGAYGVEPKGGRPITGYYLHVWKRSPQGWRLAADVTNEAPTSW